MAGSVAEKRIVMREQSNPISVQSSESVKSTNTIKGDTIRTTVIQVNIHFSDHGGFYEVDNKKITFLQWINVMLCPSTESAMQ